MNTLNAATLLQVLHHVAGRLAMLHKAGWVHADLKPGNILRRPQMHSWTLIDFGCTSQIGARLHTLSALAVNSFCVE